MHIELLEESLNKGIQKKIIVCKSDNECAKDFFNNLKQMFPNVPEYCLQEATMNNKFIITYRKIKESNKLNKICNAFGNMKFYNKIEEID
jgi:hypothetical protein